MPSDVLANRGVLMVEDGDVSAHDEDGPGVGAATGAVGDVGDPGTIGVGADGGPLLRQNTPKVKNLNTGRQNNLSRVLNSAEALVVRSEDCVAVVGMIALGNKYSKLLDDINRHCEFCPNAGIKP
jgi:hypothetical protein